MSNSIKTLEDQLKELAVLTEKLTYGVFDARRQIPEISKEWDTANTPKTQLVADSPLTTLDVWKLVPRNDLTDQSKKAYLEGFKDGVRAAKEEKA